MTKINAEAEKYSDILVGDYVDTYANLTLKEQLKASSAHRAGIKSHNEISQ